LGGVDTVYPQVAGLRDDEATIKARMMPSGPPAVSRAPDPTPNDGQIHVFPVAGNVYMLAGDGANIAVQVGPQGAFVVDTGAGKLSDKVIDAI
jgi:glyoxylase-like metal-dependent hydrolase (beta-lactamase superfamily II)